MNNKITVEGEFVFCDDTGNVVDDYTETFVLNGDIGTIGEARAVIKRLILPKLKKKNPDTKFVKTCQVIDMSPTSDKAEQVDLSKLWLEAINLSCVPDAIGEYRDEKAAMVALQRAIDKAIIRKSKPKKTEDHASL